MERGRGAALVKEEGGEMERERKRGRWESRGVLTLQKQDGLLEGAGPCLSGLFVLLSEPQQPDT